VKTTVPTYLVVALLLLSGCSRVEPRKHIDLTPAWVERFESSAGLKDTLAHEGIVSLETYARHYRAVVRDDATEVEAIYVPPLKRGPNDPSCVNGRVEPVDCGPGPSEADLRRHGPGVHINEQPRKILDGGCKMITMRIEPSTLAVKTARCNSL